jgi:hypothetical protein
MWVIQTSGSYKYVTKHFQHKFKEVPTEKLKFRSVGHFTIKDPENEDVELIVDIEEVGEGGTGPPPDVADTVDDFWGFI